MFLPLRNGCLITFKNVFMKSWNYNMNLWYVRIIVPWWNWEKLKVVDAQFLTLHEKKKNFSISVSEISENIYKYLLELIKTNSEVQEKNMSCERALNFDQWKTFSEKYKPIRVWLRLFYQFTENIVGFLQVNSNLKELSYLPWQNKYPNLKTTCHIKPKFF